MRGHIVSLARLYFHAKSLYSSIGLGDVSESSEIYLDSRMSLYCSDFEIFHVYIAWTKLEIFVNSVWSHFYIVLHTGIFCHFIKQIHALSSTSGHNTTSKSAYWYVLSCYITLFSSWVLKLFHKLISPVGEIPFSEGLSFYAWPNTQARGRWFWMVAAAMHCRFDMFGHSERKDIFEFPRSCTLNRLLLMLQRFSTLFVKHCWDLIKIIIFYPKISVVTFCQIE